MYISIADKRTDYFLPVCTGIKLRARSDVSVALIIEKLYCLLALIVYRILIRVSNYFPFHV